VNLAPKGDRAAQSHDIAKSARPQVQAIAAKYGANVKVAEVPPAKPIKSPSDPNTLQSWPITRLFFRQN